MSPARGWPWYAVPLGIVALTRLAGLVLVLLLAPDQISAATLPHDVVLPSLVDPPSYLHVIANWDGQWYRLVAEHGYPSSLPLVDGHVIENPWAFYPLFPGLVRLLMLPGLSFGLAASVVSLASCAGAMCLLYRMLVPTAGRYAAALAVLALSVAPAGVILQTAYTESLALLLVLASLWCLARRQYGALVAVALLLSLTRPIVLPLALVVVVHGVVRWRRRELDPFPRPERVTVAGVAVVVALSFLIWPVVTAVVTGRWDAYLVTQRAWLVGDGGWSPWLGALVGRGPVARLVVVGLALGALAFVVLRRPVRRWGLELRAWAVSYSLYILAATPATASVIRFALLAVVPWWPVPEIGQRVTSPRGRAALALLVAVVGLATQYLWLRWFFVIDPASRGNP